MKYETLTDNQERLLFLKLSGCIEYEPLQACFSEMEEILRYNFHLRLVIDATQVSGFDISNEVCQQMAPTLLNFARRAAFFTDNLLVFGMVRVIQSYSFNDNFAVFKTLAEAKQFVEAERNSGHLVFKQAN